MTDYRKILLAIAPHGKPALIAGFADALPDCIASAELSSKLRLAHFLAQTAHESAGLATTTEYASGRAYEGRADLGNVHPGDGPRFKGRGLIQLTGRANYAHYSADLGIDLTKNPEAAAEFPAAALIPAEYWRQRAINRDADLDSIEGVTRRVNGGLNGLTSRKAFLDKAKHALSDLEVALVARAAEETHKASAKAASATAAVTTGAASVAPVIVPNATTHAALGTGGMWALIALAVVLIAGAVWLFLSIRKHQDAATALTTAAQGV
jgi:putative chitinase